MHLIRSLEIIGARRSLILSIALLLAVGAAALDAVLIASVVPLTSELLSGDLVDVLGIDQLNLTSPVTLAVLSVVGKNLLQIASTFLISRAGFSVVTDSTLRVFRSILDRSTVAGSNAGEQQASVITEPVQMVLNVVNPIISLASNVISIVVLLFTVTLVISPQLFPLVWIFLALFFGYTIYSRAVLRKNGEARRVAEAERTGFARSALKASGETGYSSWADGVVERFLRLPTATVERAIAVKWYYTETYKNVLELTIVISAVLFFVLFDWRDNPSLVAQLAALSVAAFRIAPAVNRSMVNYQTLQFGLPSFQALASVWNATRQGAGYGLYEAGLSSGKQDAFEFRLRGQSRVITRMELTPGLFAIAGESGIGKTSLLLQMAEIVRKRKLGYLSFVSQDVLILPARLHDNIYVAPERAGLDPATSQAVLSLADTHDSVLNRSRVSTDDGSTVDAASLSGGQARRLAIMRALASNPDVLIADEPTTGLHSEMSATLIEALKNYATSHIVVVATHDPQLIAASTEVVEL